MSDDEGFSWVFESLLGFLMGPVWEAAVLTFIEKKSVVFDPAVGNEDEYKKIHDEYKNLVDTLLGSYMEDLGITPEDFEKACVETENNIQSEFRKGLFKQLWSAGDYEMFKRMMTQTNIELQLQVLDLLAHQYGLQLETFLPNNGYEPSQEEKTIMETVFRRYLEENPKESDAEKQSEQQEVIRAIKVHLQEVKQREKKLPEQAMESSREDSPKMDYEEPLENTKRTEAVESSVDDAPKTDHDEPLEVTKKTEAMESSLNDAPKRDLDETLEVTNKTEAMESSLDDAPKRDLDEPLEVTNKTELFDVVKRMVQDDDSWFSVYQAMESSLDVPQANNDEPLEVTNKIEAMESSLDDARKTDHEEPLEVTRKTEVSAEEDRRRTEYLHQQWHKLLALKKEEREKLLQLLQGAEERPRSARAARKAISDEAEERPGPKLPDFRKSFSARLKAEVVGNK